MLMLSEFELLAKTRSVALVAEAARPSGSNRRNPRTSGDPSVRRDVSVPKLVPGSTLLAYVSATGAKEDVIGDPEARGKVRTESWTNRTSTAGSAANMSEALGVLTGLLSSSGS
jgi:hypothetical protein